MQCRPLKYSRHQPTDQAAEQSNAIFLGACSLRGGRGHQLPLAECARTHAKLALEPCALGKNITSQQRRSCTIQDFQHQAFRGGKHCSTLKAWARIDALEAWAEDALGTWVDYGTGGLGRIMQRRKCAMKMWGTCKQHVWVDETNSNGCLSESSCPLL